MSGPTPIHALFIPSLASSKFCFTVLLNQDQISLIDQRELINESPMAWKIHTGAFLHGDPTNYQLPQLKCWLKYHNLIKNVSQREAIEKVLRCIALKMHVYPRLDGSKWNERKKKGFASNTTLLIPWQWEWPTVVVHKVIYILLTKIKWVL